MSTAAHSVTPAPGPLPPEPIAKCKCIPKSDLVIRSWQAGRADALEYTFVTNEETKCDLYVLISYRDRADEYILPKSYTWEKTSMSHGFVFAKQPEKIFSNFVLDATATGPEHTFVPHPRDVEDGTNGRDNKPMKIYIRFSALFECLPACAICPSNCPYANSSSGKQVWLHPKKDLEQDGIDQMRQEYVDHEIGVPSRSDFIAATYTFYTRRDAGYAHMLGKKLPGFRRAWAEKCQEILQDLSGDQSKQVSAADLIVNSGYRNPEHNDHVYGSPEDANTDSTHQYGIALDVRNIDLDGDDEVIREKDGPLMRRAALTASPKAGYANWDNYNTITHADWR